MNFNRDEETIFFFSFHSIIFTRELLLSCARFFSGEKGTVFLYSGQHQDAGQYSFLCLFPYEFISIKKNELKRSFGKPYLGIPLSGNPWDSLMKNLQFSPFSSSFPEWVGYLGYEMGAFSDPEKILQYQSSSIPDAFFQRSTLILRIDHQREKGDLFINLEGHKWLSSQKHEFLDILRWNQLLKELSFIENSSKKCVSKILFREDAESYCRKILLAQEMIREGEIYQVNLSQRFVLQSQENPFFLFETLASMNAAPFSAYLHLYDFFIVSSSPERLLTKQGSLLQTRPIKGTMPRGKIPEEDVQFFKRLLASPKEKAELLMITDLMRNDLGRVSISGSVVVKELMRCESYTNVFHLLSIIESRALSSLHPIEILRLCFPGGSVTGCPKLRAMEMISELEKRPRGIYTGSIGYFSENGDFDFNIAIRTFVIQDNLIDVQLGGGIVIDSIPLQEFQETLDKGISIFKVLGYEQI